MNCHIVDTVAIGHCVKYLIVVITVDKIPSVSVVQIECLNNCTINICNAEWSFSAMDDCSCMSHIICILVSLVKM